MRQEWYNDKYPESDWNQYETGDLDIDSILEGTPQDIANKILELDKNYTGLVLQMQHPMYDYSRDADNELVGYFYIPKTEAEKATFKAASRKRKISSLKSQNTRLDNLSNKGQGLTDKQYQRHLEVKQELEQLLEEENDFQCAAVLGALET